MAARRVLVIEDDAGARDALGCLLAEEGYLVRTAATGRLGVDCAREFSPDTVICDFFLPDLDGLQVLRELRMLRGNVYFIMLTAGCGDGEAERALRKEADLFLDKPVDLARFRTILQRAQTGAPESLDPVQALH